MTRTTITGVAGVVALLVATGGTVWASSDAPSAPRADAPAAVSRPASPSTEKAPDSASTGSSSRGSSSRGSSPGAAKAPAAAAATVTATVSRPGGPTQCTLVDAYRVADGRRTLITTFAERADRTVSGRLAAGRYVFGARDDCDTDLADVWVGGTSKGDARVFTVTSGATTRLGTITLRNDPALTLTFVSAVDGTPVVGEPFDVYDTSGTIVWSWGTDEQGRIMTTRQPVEEGENSLRAGTYRFRVAGNGFEKVEFTIDLQSDVSRTFELEPLG